MIHRPRIFENKKGCPLLFGEEQMGIPKPISKYQDLIYDVGLHKGEDAEF
jgi:hypothetical protein